MQEKYIENIIVRYIKDGDAVSIGSSKLGEAFLKKLAFALEEKDIPIYAIEFVPTSIRNATLASSLGIPIANINDREVDVAIEFVDQVDENYNYIKRDSVSIVRDKMIAQSAGLMIVVAEEEKLVKKLKGKIPFEVSSFGWKRTLNQLDAFGKARIRTQQNGFPYRTESGHYLIDVDVDDVFSYDDLEFESKAIPGVLEIGLFVGYADKIILHGKKIQLMSRMEGE